MIIAFQILVLVFSVVVHEVAHGLMAERLGDPTARLAGRLTLNPLKHLDPFGSVILPLLLALLPGGLIVGWAKSVPYNPYNLKNPDRGGALIAAVGPLSNIFLALIFGLFFRLLVLSGASALVNLASFFTIIVGINLMLALFNLVPLPPLDGSKIIMAFWPNAWGSARRFFEAYGIYLLLLFLFFGFRFLEPAFFGLYRLILGI